MPLWLTALIAILAMYVIGIAVLALAGRRVDALILARMIPDCVVFVKRLATDDRVARRYKAALLALVAYLALPFDLVPDFLPVVGLLDDVIIVVLTLRFVARGLVKQVVIDSWPGSSRSLERIVPD